MDHITEAEKVLQGLKGHSIPTLQPKERISLAHTYALLALARELRLQNQSADEAKTRAA